MLTPPSPYQLRPMALTDVETVYQIDRLSFPTPARKGIFEHELGNNKIAHYQSLIMAGAIVGFAGYWLIADEIHISTIAVHPDYQGRHLGELLLLNVLFDAYKHPANTVTLEVRQSNRIAQQLYKKYRFEAVGERRRYYKDTGEDALIMIVPSLDAGYFAFLVSQRSLLFEALTSEVSRP